MENSYYAIAVGDLQYLQHSLSFPGYNQIVVQAQQIAEKLLKSVAENVCMHEPENVLKTHNLKKIYMEIKKYGQFLELDVFKLGYLKDFYFEAKYPGENFIVVDREQCSICLNTMYDILQEVNHFRKDLQEDVVEFERIMLPHVQEIQNF